MTYEQFFVATYLCSSLSSSVDNNFVGSNDTILLCPLLYLSHTIFSSDMSMDHEL
jgi:hypothetical protein